MEATVGWGRRAGEQRARHLVRGLVQVLEEALVLLPPQLFPWVPFTEAAELLLEATTWGWYLCHPVPTIMSQDGL